MWLFERRSDGEREREREKETRIRESESIAQCSQYIVRNIHVRYNELQRERDGREGVGLKGEKWIGEGSVE